MPLRTDTFELAPLGLRSGDGRRLDLHVPMADFHYGGEPYAVTPELVPVRLDVSRTTPSSRRRSSASTTRSSASA